MAVDLGFQGHVIFRLGLSTEIAGALLDNGEPAYTLNDKTVWIGDQTAEAMKIATTKSTGVFDFSSSSKWILPGGVIFDTTKPGSFGGITLADLNKANGFVVRTGDGRFTNVTLTSANETITIGALDTSTNQINLELNPESELLNGANAKVFVGPNPPENPKLGIMWFDNAESVLYLRVVDGANAIWLSLT